MGRETHRETCSGEESRRRSEHVEAAGRKRMNGPVAGGEERVGERGGRGPGGPEHTPLRHRGGREQLIR